MTAAGGPTYGQLMDAAMRHLAAAATQPVELDVRQAVEVAQARARLYAAASAVLEVYAVTPLKAGGRSLGAFVSVNGRQRSVVDSLDEELTASVRATRRVLDVDPTGLPSSPAPYAESVGRAVESARLAWEVLAAARHRGDPTELAHGDAARSGDAGLAALIDAVDLVRGVAERDPDLVHGLGAAARAVPHTGTQESVAVRVALTYAAEDCAASSKQGLATTARLAGQLLSSQHRGGIDAIAPVPILEPPADLRVPEDAVTAVEAYLQWLGRSSGGLRVTDLASLAAVSSRLAGLTGLVHSESLGVGLAAARAVDAWRKCYVALAPLVPVDPAPVRGAAVQLRLARWLDGVHRAGISEADHPRWAEATRTAAGVLPRLATAAEHALHLQVTEGRVLSPTGRLRLPGLPPPQEYRYQPVQPDDDHLAQTTEALPAARLASAVLAQTIGAGTARAAKAPTPPEVAGVPTRGLGLSGPAPSGADSPARTADVPAQAPPGAERPAAAARRAAEQRSARGRGEPNRDVSREHRGPLRRPPEPTLT